MILVGGEIQVSTGDPGPCLLFLAELSLVGKQIRQPSYCDVVDSLWSLRTLDAGITMTNEQR